MSENKESLKERLENLEISSVEGEKVIDLILIAMELFPNEIPAAALSKLIGVMSIDPL
jgi:hypothetical protein